MDYWFVKSNIGELRSPLLSLPVLNDGVPRRARWRDRIVGINPRSRQGSLGSCAVLAVGYGTTFKARKVGKETHAKFTFYDSLTGLPEQVTVTTRDTFKNGSDGGAGLLEKAYWKWARGEVRVLPAVPYEGGLSLSAVLQDFGHRNIEMEPDQAMIINAVNAGKPVVYGTMADSEYLVIQHGYRVIGASPTGLTFLNPWGFDGRRIQGLDDGRISLTWDQIQSQNNGGYFRIGA